MLKWEQGPFSLLHWHMKFCMTNSALISVLNMAELLAFWASGSMETHQNVLLNQTIATMGCCVALRKLEFLWLSLLIAIKGQTTFNPSLRIIFSELTLSIASPQNKHNFSNKEDFGKQGTLRGEELQKIVVLINLQQSKAISFLYETVTTQKSLKTF